MYRKSNIKKEHKMKRIISLLISVLLLISFATLFTSCDSEETYDETYNLVAINFANITVDQYEYNYIKFNTEKGIYKVQNKVNGIVTRQTGDYYVNDNNYVTFTNDNIPSQDYVLYDGESAYFRGNRLYVTATIPGYGNVSMTFEKE